MPKRGDPWGKIIRYAIKLDGYRKAGSFEKAAVLGNAVSIKNFNKKELKIALFFEYRRCNFSNYSETSLERIYKLLDRLNESTKGQAK